VKPRTLPLSYACLTSLLCDCRYIYGPSFNMLTLVSRSVPCLEFPCKHVQIDQYRSTLIVKPTGHSTPLDVSPD